MAFHTPALSTEVLGNVQIKKQKQLKKNNTHIKHSFFPHTLLYLTQIAL